MDPIAQLAARQGGVVTRTQALATGMTERMISRRTASGRWKVEGPGSYRLFAALDETDLLLGATVVLSDAVVSHGSAARLLGLPLKVPVRAEVTVGDSSTHVLAGVVVHRTRVALTPDVATKGNLRCTNVARTLVDLAGTMPELDWVGAADELVIKGRLRLDRLGTVAGRVCGRGRAGSALVRDYLLRRADTANRSELEKRGHELLHGAGITEGVSEFPIPWDPHRRFDVAFPSEELAIEWDSRHWHGSLAAMTSDRRRDRAAGVHGWLVVRFTWEDITETPDEVIATVARLLARRSEGGSGPWRSSATRG